MLFLEGVELLKVSFHVMSLNKTLLILKPFVNWTSIFIFTLLCGAAKGFIKAFIKLFEAPRISVKIKIWLNFYFNTTFNNEYWNLVALRTVIFSINLDSFDNLNRRRIFFQTILCNNCYTYLKQENQKCNFQYSLTLRMKSYFLSQLSNSFLIWKILLMCKLLDCFTVVYEH